MTTTRTFNVPDTIVNELDAVALDLELVKQLVGRLDVLGRAREALRAFEDWRDDRDGIDALDDEELRQVSGSGAVYDRLRGLEEHFGQAGYASWLADNVER